jgi:hypothetical protein
MSEKSPVQEPEPQYKPMLRNGKASKLIEVSAAGVFRNMHTKVERTLFLSHGKWRFHWNEDEIPNNASAHRLVCETWNPNPENKPLAGFKTLDHQNIRADNVVWRTRRESAVLIDRSAPKEKFIVRTMTILNGKEEMTLFNKIKKAANAVKSVDDHATKMENIAVALDTGEDVYNSHWTYYVRPPITETTKWYRHPTHKQYEFSNHGHGRRQGADEELNVNECMGYLITYVKSSKATKRTSPGLHVLVWEANHGKMIPDGQVVNHIDGTRFQNNIDNLEVISQGKNVRAAYFLKNPQTIVKVYQINVATKAVTCHPSVQDAGDSVHVTPDTIRLWCRDKTPCFGYMWQYENPNQGHVEIVEEGTLLIDYSTDEDGSESDGDINDGDGSENDDNVDDVTMTAPQEESIFEEPSQHPQSLFSDVDESDDPPPKKRNTKTKKDKVPLADEPLVQPSIIVHDNSEYMEKGILWRQAVYQEKKLDTVEVSKCGMFRDRSNKEPRTLCWQYRQFLIPLFNGKKGRTVQAHHVVIETWKGRRAGAKNVVFIDEDTRNLHSHNLEWKTPVELRKKARQRFTKVAIYSKCPRTQTEILFDDTSTAANYMDIPGQNRKIKMNAIQNALDQEGVVVYNQLWKTYVRPPMDSSLVWMSHPKYKKIEFSSGGHGRYIGGEKELYPTIQMGYLVVHFPIKRKSIGASLHILVWEAHNKAPAHRVRHKNGSKHDNRLLNLKC